MRGELVSLAPWVVFALICLLLVLNAIGVGGWKR